MLKLVLAIVGGIVAAFAIVFATDALFHALFASAAPPPDPSAPDAMRDYIAGQPVSALIVILIGWAVAAFAGSAIAARFGGRGRWPGWLVAAIFLLATVANFLMVVHPTWMVAAGLVLIVIAGWLGARAPATTDRTLPTVRQPSM